MKNFVSEIAISFFFTSIFVLIFYFFLEPSISKGISLINSITVKENMSTLKEEYDFTNKRLVHYPTYGTKYGKLIISSINLEMAIYHGDTKRILMLGIGHYTGSYFPGENGTILYAGHNNVGYLSNLQEVKIDDLITIETSYGTFNYQVNDIKVVNENDLEAFKIKDNEEMLIIYTCFPIDRSIVGRKKERMVVYSKRVTNEEI